MRAVNSKIKLCHAQFIYGLNKTGQSIVHWTILLVHRPPFSSVDRLVEAAVKTVDCVTWVKGAARGLPTRP
jgi:hypothetical protein